MWRASIKAVESKLGTAVASFFVFMRWVFLLNVFLSCLWFGAVILPQLASPVKQNHTTTSFDAWTLFVGEVLFYNVCDKKRILMDAASFFFLY